MFEVSQVILIRPGDHAPAIQMDLSRLINNVAIWKNVISLAGEFLSSFML